LSKDLRIHDYISHILNAIERINRYTEDMDKSGFLCNDMVQDAVIRNIEIIGEASNNILRTYPEFASRNSDIPWQIMYTMRNRVSHGYHSLDLEIVWTTIRRDLPFLYQRVIDVCDSLTTKQTFSGNDSRLGDAEDVFDTKGIERLRPLKGGLNAKLLRVTDDAVLIQHAGRKKVLDAVIPPEHRQALKEMEGQRVVLQFGAQGLERVAPEPVRTRGRDRESPGF